MPVIAESPPIIFGGGEEPPSIPPAPYVPPTSPSPTPPFVPQIPSTGCTPGNIESDHKIFIGHVDQLDECFSREMLPEFTDQNFQLHSNIAITDKYLTKNGDLYCSMQAVQNLSQKLKRFRD